jgi:hypothetical protein
MKFEKKNYGSFYNSNFNNLNLLHTVTPTASKNINLDLLQRKISNLETENKSLKQEVAQVVQQTDEVEEQERKLMEDITQQLNSTNVQFDGLSELIDEFWFGEWVRIPIESSENLSNYFFF